MKKRFGILISILILVSIGLMFFNNSSSKKLKESNSSMQLKLQSLQKQEKELKETKDNLLSEKKALENKLKK